MVGHWSLDGVSGFVFLVALHIVVESFINVNK